MSVASIRGGPLPGEPHPKVVAMLERYLEQAKAGEIDGAAIAISRPDGRRTLENVFTSASAGNLCIAVVALFFAFGAGMTSAHNFQDAPPA